MHACGLCYYCRSCELVPVPDRSVAHCPCCSLDRGFCVCCRPRDLDQVDWIFTSNSNEGDNALWAFFVMLVLPALERSCCCRYLHRGVGADGANLNSQAVCILALLGLLALSAPAADARQLKQAAITDADILNFALNLEVRSSTIAEPACNLLNCFCALPC